MVRSWQLEKSKIPYVIAVIILVLVGWYIWGGGESVEEKAEEKEDKKTVIIKDFNVDLEELCENIQEGIGVSFYNTGEKMVSLSCQLGAFIPENSKKLHYKWMPKCEIYYYKNGNKKSKQIHETWEEEGPYTSWYENGNMEFSGDFSGDSFGDEWYENGQEKKIVEIKKADGLGNQCVSKEECYYESGQRKSLFICEDCDPEGVRQDCAPKRCFSPLGESINCD